MARLRQKIIITLTVGLLLTGCSTFTTSVPVTKPFPSIPEALLVECGPLNIIGKDEVKLSELMNIVNKNYTKYHECAIMLNAWQEWYKDQQKIFDIK